MKTFKKFFALIFAFVMAVSVFAIAACAQPEDNGNQNGTEQGGTNTPTPDDGDNSGTITPNPDGDEENGEQTPNPDGDKEQDKEIEYVAGTEGLKYTLNSDGNSYSCTGIGTATETDITIASHYNDLLVTSIGNTAFYDCTSLVSIIIPNSVTSIGRYAFENCRNLESITISDSVTSIDVGAFDNTAYHNNESNWDNNVLYIGNHLIQAKIEISGSYSIKSGTRTIAGGAFQDCYSLTSITIPNSVTTIVNFAFTSCTSLTSIAIPDSVTTIGDTAFYNCTSLTNITIPDSVTYIAKWVFAECTGLTSITIHDSVTTIGDLAFYGCTSLTSINYNGTTEQWNELQKGSGWDDNTANYIIYCTDGEIAKDGTVTKY